MAAAAAAVGNWIFDDGLAACQSEFAFYRERKAWTNVT